MQIRVWSEVAGGLQIITVSIFEHNVTHFMKQTPRAIYHLIMSVRIRYIVCFFHFFYFIYSNGSMYTSCYPLCIVSSYRGYGPSISPQVLSHDLSPPQHHLRLSATIIFQIDIPVLSSDIQYIVNVPIPSTVLNGMTLPVVWTVCRCTDCGAVCDVWNVQCFVAISYWTNSVSDMHLYFM